MTSSGETIAACLTPAGTGAIAVVALRGPAALAVVQKLFRPLPGALDQGRFYLGKFGEETKDDVVLSVMEGGPDYWFELQCHGGREVVQLVLETLTRQQVHICSWTDFETRNAGSPLQAAATVALSRAATVRTASILLDQYHGALARAVASASTCSKAGQTSQAIEILEELVRRSPVGLHLTEPWRVVVAGAPNVGKSSLINAIAGYQRSVVSSIPGTTRDLVATTVALDGWPVELVDTAGLRGAAECDLESAGMSLARTSFSGADLVLWVLDGSAEPSMPTDETGAVQMVINKIDRPPGWDWDQVAKAIRVSAASGEGLPGLLDGIVGRLVPDVPSPGAAVPFTRSLVDQISTSLQAMKRSFKSE